MCGRDRGLEQDLALGVRLELEREGCRLALVLDLPDQAPISSAAVGPLAGCGDAWMVGAAISQRLRAAAIMLGDLFFLEEAALARRSPAVAAEGPIGPDHSMARHHERQAVARAGAGHGPHGLRLSDGLGDLGVGAGLAIRDLLQRAPHAPLEGRGRDVDRQVQARDGPVEMGQDRGQHRLQHAVVAHDLGAGVVLAQRRLERRVGLAELDGAESALGRGHQQAAELRRRRRKRTFSPAPPRL